MKHITRIILITLTLLSITLSGRLGNSFATGQNAPNQRAVVAKPWHVEPIKIVSIKTNKTEKVELGKPFVEDDDRLNGFTVTVLNKYYKTITVMT